MALLDHSNSADLKIMFQDFSDIEIQYILKNFEIKDVYELSNKLLTSKKANDSEVESHLLGFVSYQDRQNQINEIHSISKNMEDKNYVR